MAEIRVFHEDKFLCRAVCAELAGATVPLREILRARNRQRRELRGVLGVWGAVEQKTGLRDCRRQPADRDVNVERGQPNCTPL